MTRRQRFFQKNLARLRADREDHFRRAFIYYHGKYAILHEHGRFSLWKRGQYVWQPTGDSSHLYSAIHDKLRMRRETSSL